MFVLSTKDGSGQHGLAATEDVAVLLEEVELGDGHVALQVGLLVDEELDLAVADRLGGVGVGVERPDLALPRRVWVALTVSRACGAPRVTIQLIDLSWVELGLDGGGDRGVVGAVDLQVLGVREARP